LLRSCPANFTDLVIHGDRFSAMADVELNYHAGGQFVMRNLPLLGRGARVVFVKTDFVPTAFAHLQRIADPEPFVLVTHNSDYAINARLFGTAPPCVAAWYALNVAHEAPNLFPIPTGMQRPGGGGHSADYAMVPRAWKRATDRPNIAFSCWTTKNNPRERTPVEEAFRDRKSITRREPTLSHLDFLTECGRSRFVISPPGNGIDCHRTWEAMYMGAIPLVSRSIHMEAFAGLPLVLVDDWSRMTDDELARIHAEYSARSWTHEKLFFPYWEEQIRARARAL
jgi:hypothetical protein